MFKEDQAETACQSAEMAFSWDLQLFAEDPPADPPADPADPPADPADPPADPAPKTYPESYVKKIHTENAARRKREEELTKKLKEYEDRDLAAETDLKKKAEALEKRAKDIEREYTEKLTARDRRLILSEAKRLAKEHGMIDVDDVKTLDLSDLRLDDEDDAVPGLAEKIATLKESKPHWFKAAKVEPEPRKQPGVPPARKDGDPPTKDWATADPADFSKHMERLGVKI